MVRGTVRGYLAVAAAALAVAVPALASERDQKVAELEAKVAQLEAKQSQSQQDVARTIDAVLRDAERRSQLLANDAGASAGYDSGFFIKSGDFTFKPSVVFQFRNVTDYREETAGAKDDEIENGFEVRRLQFNIQGTAFTKDLTYNFQWNTNRDGGDVFLEDAWVRYFFADDWAFRIGQLKGQVTHEKILSDSRLTAVERSLQDGFVTGQYVDRLQAVSLIYGGYLNNNPLNVEVALTDGANSKNSDYVGHYPNDPAPLGPTSNPSNHQFDFGATGRIEYKFSGDWKQYGDLTAASSVGAKENLFVIGGGFDWSQGGDGDSLIGTVDVDFETTNGLALYGALAVRHQDEELAGADDDRFIWSLLGQVSYALNPQWEIFGRYTWLDYEDEIASAGDEDTFHEVTVGAIYYLGKNGSAGHRAKVTIDLNWLPNGAPAALKGAGYLGDSGGDNEIVIRGQFQLII